MTIERLVTPSANTDLLTSSHLPAPDDVRGFLMYQGRAGHDCIGYETPTDPASGLPLPVLPIAAPPLSTPAEIVNFHHHFHPRPALIADGDAGIAVRVSRGQYLPKWLHDHYHNYFAGPRVPQTRDQKFRTCVLACAGVIPDQAIDFSGYAGPKLTQMTADQYTRVAATIAHEGFRKLDGGITYRNWIGSFFANYAIEQSFENEVSPHVIDQFLSTPDAIKKAKLGRFMLKAAINAAVMPVKPLYADLYQEGMVSRRQRDLDATVKDYFIKSRRLDYIPALDQKLRPAA